MNPQPTKLSLKTLFLVLAAELLLLTFFQLPGTADFQMFGFFDQGAWLHLDQLFAGGAIPTVDLGYSYGMLPLFVTRAWVALFGRSPWAFIAFVTLCNLLAAWGVARILHQIGASRRRLLAACALLPLAIMPNTYSMMHPLEMMLIISALAEQIRGRLGWALALATLAVFTKPSMAYVLGFLLLLSAFLPNNIQSPGTPSQEPYTQFQKWRRILLPPLCTAILFLVLSILIVGLRPALANILPLTGGRSYRAMNFGFFHAGQTFWLHTGPPMSVLIHYVFNPALFWILSTLLLWLLGLRGALRLWQRHPVDAPNSTDPFLVTVALLHAAFVFVFYAWEGSWTYYSYLLVIGLLVGLRDAGREKKILASLAIIGLLGLSQKYLDAFNRFWGMTYSADAGGLFVYPDVLAEARQVRALAQQHHGLYLINGTLPTLWPEAQTPPCWFLSPGIPTPAEIKKVKQQIAAAGVIVLYLPYDQSQEAWKWPEFAEERAKFDPVPVLETKHFRVLQRKSE